MHTKLAVTVTVKLLKATARSNRASLETSHRFLTVGVWKPTKCEQKIRTRGKLTTV